MRILWFTNIPMPAMLGNNNEDHAATGGWMIALLNHLQAAENIKIGVVCICPQGDNQHLTAGGIDYFTLSLKSHKRFFHFSDPDKNSQFMDTCVGVIQNWRPDIIHVHGTERPYGLMTAIKEINVPVVISIQGLLSEYAKWGYSFGDIRMMDIIRMHRPLDFIRGLGPLWTLLQNRRKGNRETIIIQKNEYFIGRTVWDKAHVKALNANVQYHYGGELLRPDFALHQWGIADIRRHSLIFTNMRNPRHNIETLFLAVAQLRAEYPDMELRIAGMTGFSGGYGRYLKRLADEWELTHLIKFMGRLNGKDMAAVLSHTHAFVLPSLIENSPNSLCEAQMVGMPCIAAYTGGVPSLVEDGKTGFCFPPKDAPVLAERIRAIFRSDTLAQTLGAAARKVALDRHNPTTTVNSLTATYQHIIDNHNKYKSGQSLQNEHE